MACVDCVALSTLLRDVDPRCCAAHASRSRCAHRMKALRMCTQVGGVDVSPIVWVALLSFVNEILLGPQGILNLLQRKLDL